MKVLLHQPRREVEVSGTATVKALLNRLDWVSESVLVIRGDQLLTDFGARAPWGCDRNTLGHLRRLTTP